MREHGAVDRGWGLGGRPRGLRGFDDHTLRRHGRWRGRFERSLQQRRELERRHRVVRDGCAVRDRHDLRVSDRGRVFGDRFVLPGTGCGLRRIQRGLRLRRQRGERRLQRPSQRLRPEAPGAYRSLHRARGGRGLQQRQPVRSGFQVLLPLRDPGLQQPVHRSAGRQRVPPLSVSPNFPPLFIPSERLPRFAAPQSPSRPRSTSSFPSGGRPRGAGEEVKVAVAVLARPTFRRAPWVIVLRATGRSSPIPAPRTVGSFSQGGRDDARQPSHLSLSTSCSSGSGGSHPPRHFSIHPWATTSSGGCRTRVRSARMSDPPITTIASGFCV